MSRLKYFTGRSIRSRLLLIAAFVCAGFAATIFLVFLAFNHIQALTHSVIDKDLSEVMENARIGRELSTVFAGAGQILQVFYGNETYLETNGRALLEKSRQLRDNAPAPGLQKQLRAFSSALELMLARCQDINILLQSLNQDETQAQKALSRMEQAFYSIISSRETLGMDALIWRERLATLDRLRDRLEEVDKSRAAFWLQNPAMASAPDHADRAQLVDVLANMADGVRGLSQKNPELADPGTALQAALKQYAEHTSALYLLMIDLAGRRQTLNAAKSRIASLMEGMASQTVNAASRVNESITDIIRSTGFTLICSGLVIILALCLGLIFFFRGIIINPMRATLSAIESIRNGDLNTAVRLNRKDEWGRIEEALNAMARELSDSYSAIRLSEKNYRDIFENATEGIFQTTPLGHFYTANPAMARILRYDGPDDLQNAVNDIAKQLFSDEADWKTIAATLEEGGEIRGFEARMIRKDGHVIWVAINAHAILDADGGILFFEGSVTDVTARKHAERKLDLLHRHLKSAVSDRTKKLTQKAAELERANKRLRELDAMKSAFVSSVSHELRTPLTSVLGFAKLTRRDFDQDFAPLATDGGRKEKKARRISRNLEIITSEGERLTRLINDVLDLNKIESGRMQWRDAEVSPREVIEHALEAARGQFSANAETSLVMDVPGDLPKLFVDPDRLAQVLINLLNNAAKFSSKGEIRVTARQAGNSAIQIRVRDQGVGIPKEDLERIFHKFQQVESTSAGEEKPTGTGLGLTICRHIISRYGGRIWAESEPGQGSEFIFEIPLPMAAPTRKTDDGRMTEVPAPLILTVDDEPAFSAYMSQILTQRGYRVVSAADGAAALKKAVDYRPSLITMDALMPGMDGGEVVKRLRSDPEMSDIPILVISQMDSPRIENVDAAIRKPLTEHALVSAVEGLLKPENGAGEMERRDEDRNAAFLAPEKIRRSGKTGADDALLLRLEADDVTN
jgi:PAS domain S-box-containing protein